MRLALLVVVACASPHPIAAPGAAAMGAIAGHIDLTPGEVGVGATVVATGGGSDQAVIADEAGQYQIDLRPGTYRLTVYYDDETVELGQVEVHPGATAKANATLDPLTRCASKHQGGLAGTQAERDAVVTAVLERFVRDRPLITGADLLPRQAILVELDPGPSRPISMGALPVRPAAFVPATHALIEALSARSGEPVPYITFTDLRFVGECAVVQYGVAVAGGKPCCSSSREIYEVTDDRAVFRESMTRR